MSRQWLIVADRTLLYVPTLGLCSFAVDCLTGSLENPKDARQVFAMAYGLFGRISISLPSEGFFDQVMELLNLMMGFCSEAVAQRDSPFLR